MRTSAELREGYLAFFESKGHKRVPSASLIPRADDRSTLLTSAGMQPMMPYFLGLETPPSQLLTTSQKSFRTQDIDEVGLDGHHLTFFEMLGNFSFGQYFKEGAIEFAREFVLEHMRLDWERIWVTVHAGDPQLKLGPDEVAIELWQRVGMPIERIVPLPTAENFWSVGGPGPCGPDSELYYDWGEEHGCGEADCAPACTRCARFLEFWNLVFMSLRAARGRHADAAAEGEHRHRASGSSAALRSSRTSCPSTTRTATGRSWTGSPRSPASRTETRRPRRRRTASSPTTAAA